MERLSKCKPCQFNSTKDSISTFSTCKACGCNLALKTASLSSNCGIEVYNESHEEKLELKWYAVSSKEESQEIQKASQS